MTEVTLDFLARQMERVLDRIGAIEDQLTVLTEMMIVSTAPPKASPRIGGR
jgi:hypothetical protein